MTAKEQAYYTMSCDHDGGCSAEVETDGMTMVYNSVADAREAAYDVDWATDIDGRDYCFDHWVWEDDEDGGHRVPRARTKGAP